MPIRREPHGKQVAIRAVGRTDGSAMPTIGSKSFRSRSEVPRPSIFAGVSNSTRRALCTSSCPRVGAEGKLLLRLDPFGDHAGDKVALLANSRAEYRATSNRPEVHAGVDRRDTAGPFKRLAQRPLRVEARRDRRAWSRSNRRHSGTPIPWGRERRQILSLVIGELARRQPRRRRPPSQRPSAPRWDPIVPRLRSRRRERVRDAEAPAKGEAQQAKRARAPTAADFFRTKRNA